MMEKTVRVFSKEANVHIVPIIEDNYVFIFECPETQRCAIVDPGEAQPVLEYVKKNELDVEKIIITHHHWDHITGVDALREELSLEVVGHKHDQNRLPKLNYAVSEGANFKIGNTNFEVISLDGHTIGHLGYFSRATNVLFSGDTLFMMGCGRLFEGSPSQMWQSLSKIRSLPNDTLIFCTHEYSLANAKFCASVLGKTYEHYYAQIQAELLSRKRTVPASLHTEKKRNPFLNCDSIELATSLSMAGTKPSEVFAKLRSLKDNF